MSTRLGSCTPKGKIILNPELIKVPKGCIEYVFIHDLCHLIHHDHTRKFIELQTKRNEGFRNMENEIGKIVSMSKSSRIENTNIYKKAADKIVYSACHHKGVSQPYMLV